ncbi:hypothetical protein BGZ88_005553, partial [Linnemannia elongata]
PLSAYTHPLPMSNSTDTSSLSSTFSPAECPRMLPYFISMARHRTRNLRPAI